MNSSKPLFLKHIFVCENQREGGRPFCGHAGTHLRKLLKNEIKNRGLSDRVRVSLSGCLDVCSHGANILLMPDNIWFSRVKEGDLEEILKKTTEGLL